MTTQTFRILPLAPEAYPDFSEHMLRHRAESGRGGVHFMPFEPGDRDGPVGVLADRLLLPIGTPGWQRCFVALDPDSDLVIGHVNLKSNQLRTMRHRCELGLGIEEQYRGMGLGNALMDTIIGFARAQPELEWIDLYTFETNTPARALYLKKGFSMTGIVADRFRIDGLSFGDVIMSLKVK